MNKQFRHILFSSAACVAVIFDERILGLQIFYKIA